MGREAIQWKQVYKDNISYTFRKSKAYVINMMIGLRYELICFPEEYPFFFFFFFRLRAHFWRCARKMYNNIILIFMPQISKDCKKSKRKKRNNNNIIYDFNIFESRNNYKKNKLEKSSLFEHFMFRRVLLDESHIQGKNFLIILMDNLFRCKKIKKNYFSLLTILSL